MSTTLVHTGTWRRDLTVWYYLSVKVTLFFVISFCWDWKLSQNIEKCDGSRVNFKNFGSKESSNGFSLWCRSPNGKKEQRRRRGIVRPRGTPIFTGRGSTVITPRLLAPVTSTTRPTPLVELVRRPATRHPFLFHNDRTVPRWRVGDPNFPISSLQRSSKKGVSSSGYQTGD